jgi:hypothetical protein
MTLQGFAAIALLGVVPVGCTSQIPLTQATHAQRARDEARRFGLSERVGEWRLARYVPGTDAHFLFVDKGRGVSCFITPMKSSADLTLRTGWRSISLPDGTTGYLHHDSRQPQRNALAWKHGTQRRIIQGRISPDELVRIAPLL